jgi:c-di-GMP-binding flagellar brake protein YcgR
MPLSSDPNFVLSHRADVLAILDRMQAERTLTTIEFGNGHAIVSIVLEVRRDTNALIFDISRDVDTNRALFASQALAFISELDSIQIGFETNAASLVAFSDGPAAVVELPAAVTRLQRREWFRAALPVQPPIRCTVLDRDGNAIPAQAIDLSCGGAGVVIDDAALCEAVPGSDHELILSLPEVGRLDLEATLRTVRPAIGLQGQGAPAAKLRLGFRFEGLPPKTANQIQRYVQRLEVDQLRVLRRRAR